MVPPSVEQPAQEPVKDKTAKLKEACGKHEDFAAIAAEPDAKILTRKYIELCAEAETIELTSKLIEFPTVSAREPATGDSFNAMRDYLDRWSKDAGLEFRTHGENDAWEIGLGVGPAKIAFVMHGDVVPIDDGLDLAGGDRVGTIDAITGEPLPPGWTKPPFRGTVSDGKLYGRGSEDDKGPIAAVLVVMRALKKLAPAQNGRILAVIGTGEEHDWTGMKRYVDANQPQAKYVISIDANFPVVVAESGFVAWQLAAPMKPGKNSKRCTLASEARAGMFLTQVPGEATMTLEPRNETLERLMSRAQNAASEVAKESAGKLRIELSPDAGRVKMTVYGDAVHSSVAETGQNALWGLAQAAERIGLCDNGIRAMLSVVTRYFAGDHWGEKLGLSYEHEMMGRLLVTPTLLRIDAGDAKLSVNMRRPAGKTSAEFTAGLATALALIKKNINPAIKEAVPPFVGDPALANTEGPLVPALLEAYRRETGDREAQPISIRGGTYARLFQGAVSFGPSLPGRPYRGHSPDEYVELEALRVLNRALLDVVLALP
jgi:predicted dipeptidase